MASLPLLPLHLQSASLLTYAKGELPSPDSLSLTYLKPTGVNNFYVVKVQPLQITTSLPPTPSLPPADSSLDTEAQDLAPHKDMTKQPLSSERPAGPGAGLVLEATLWPMDQKKPLVKARAAFSSYPPAAPSVSEFVT